MRAYFPERVAWGQSRDGGGWKWEDINAWINGGGLLLASPITRQRMTDKMHGEGDYSVADVEAAYKEALDKVGSAQTAYNKLIDVFNGRIKNDLSSIGASADRVLKESAKMRAAYDATAKVLNSPEMEQAIANAERLAKALEAISALQSHSITFAVLDKKPASITQTPSAALATAQADTLGSGVTGRRDGH